MEPPIEKTCSLTQKGVLRSLPTSCQYMCGRAGIDGRCTHDPIHGFPIRRRFRSGIVPVQRDTSLRILEIPLSFMDFHFPCHLIGSVCGGGRGAIVGPTTAHVKCRSAMSFPSLRGGWRRITVRELGQQRHRRASKFGIANQCGGGWEQRSVFVTARQLISTLYQNKALPNRPALVIGGRYIKGKGGAILALLAL